VPTEIASLKGQLRGLYLSDNKLEGEIPTALCELQQLGKLLNRTLLLYSYDQKHISFNVYLSLVLS